MNYGPWSNECVDLLNSLPNKILIQGNHEIAFITGSYPGNNEIARRFFETCYKKFDRKQLIEGYRRDYTLHQTKFAHTLNDSYIFYDSPIHISEDTFIGHSHRLFERQIDGYRLVNVGSVGQNRINADEINYALWYPDNRRVDLIRVRYSADALLTEMKQSGYPQECIKYIENKRIN